MRLNESTLVVEEREKVIEKKEALERINLEVWIGKEHIEIFVLIFVFCFVFLMYIFAFLWCMYYDIGGKSVSVYSDTHTTMYIYM